MTMNPWTIQKLVNAHREDVMRAARSTASRAEIERDLEEPSRIAISRVRAPSPGRARPAGDAGASASAALSCSPES